MQHVHIPGLASLSQQFAEMVEDIRSKPYDLLDVDKTYFDRDFLDFNVHINNLEDRLQVGSAISMLKTSCRKISSTAFSRIHFGCLS